jgi:hypothetical protein
LDHRDTGGRIRVKETFRKEFVQVSLSPPPFLGSTAQLRPWLPPQNSAEFLGGFSTIFFFTG